MSLCLWYLTDMYRVLVEWTTAPGQPSGAPGRSVLTPQALLSGRYLSCSGPLMLCKAALRLTSQFMAWNAAAPVWFQSATLTVTFCLITTHLLKLFFFFAVLSGKSGTRLPLQFRVSTAASAVQTSHVPCHHVYCITSVYLLRAGRHSAHQWSRMAQCLLHDRKEFSL